MSAMLDYRWLNAGQVWQSSISLEVTSKGYSTFFRSGDEICLLNVKFFFSLVFF